LTSAFKNFFITFAVCLLVFVFLGFKFVDPWLSSVFDINNMFEDSSSSAETSDDASSDVSSEADVSVPDVDVSDFDPDGDIFTAIIMCVDGDGNMVTSVFLDSNGKTKRFIYCPIRANTVISLNGSDKTCDAGDLFGVLTNEEVCQCVTAMTGIQTDYCLRFDRNDLITISAMIPGASVALNDKNIPAEVISDIENSNSTESGEPAEPVYVEVDEDGTIDLNDKKNGKKNIEWILSYTPSNHNTAIHGEFTEYYKLVAEAIIRAFFQQENSTKTVNNISKVLNCCDTNLNVNTAASHIETIFAYNDFERFDSFVYSNREHSIRKLREMDGRFK